MSEQNTMEDLREKLVDSIREDMQKSYNDMKDKSTFEKRLNTSWWHGLLVGIHMYNKEIDEKRLLKLWEKTFFVRKKTWVTKKEYLELK